MDFLLAVQQYVNEMIRLAGPGMKVILMDKETTSIISCAFAQSEMMQKEVYLFERIDSGSVLTLGRIEITQVCTILHLFFEHHLKADVKTLAESDEQETVREVREFYGDVIPLAPHLCSLGIANCYETPFNMSVSIFRRCLQGIVGVLLSTKKKPVIRYQSTSVMHSVFPMNYTRHLSEDPVSPLLNQWTYEAMVHELIGKNIVLSAQHDEFYSKNMYMNFGDIGQNIKALMNDYQKKGTNTPAIGFKKISGTVSKHVQSEALLDYLMPGEPYITQVIDQVSRGRLPDSLFSTSGPNSTKCSLRKCDCLHHWWLYLRRICFCQFYQCEALSKYNISEFSSCTSLLDVQ
uniref:Uncharacterized protein n=1 Tax=Ditylenchus dipsaci TaxID=166011 RepID=A0A915EPX7_9BILA